ncbi:Mobile element protein [Polaromonas sp. CG9_12]|nr:Mobile element protein [Polaromonas sp. CG9_12]
MPLTSRLKHAGLQLDVVTANIEVARWLAEVANDRVHGTTGVQPSARLRQERPSLQPMAAPWRGDMAAARPAQATAIVPPGAPAHLVRPAAVTGHMAQALPIQHPLAVYEQLLSQIAQGAEA